MPLQRIKSSTNHITRISVLLIVAAIILASCNSSRETPPELQEAIAADNMRYETPTGYVEDDQVIPNMRIDLANHFPIWRSEIAVDVHIVIRNLAHNFLASQTHARLFIYDYQQKVPLYWSNIDLAHAKSTGPGTLSIISLPIGATKDLLLPIQATTWADISIKEWPNKNLYDFIPPKKFLMRLELELFNMEDKHIGTAVSNFIEFTAIRNAPEVIRTSTNQ